MPKRPLSDKKFQDITQPVDLQAIRDSVKTCFSEFPDPRKQSLVIYPAWVLIFIFICATLAGHTNVSGIAWWAQMNEENFLRPLFGEDFRSPSYDTIWWLLIRVTPEAFNKMLSSWWERLPADLQTKMFALDGKRIIGAGTGKDRVLLVELFATEDRLVIAQKSVPAKNSEPLAVPSLLNTIDMTGALVSYDALYSTLEITKATIDAGADYLVALKANQSTLMDHVVNYFEQAAEAGPEWEELKTHTSDNQGLDQPRHGRQEQRVVSVSHNTNWLAEAGYKDWGIASIVRVQSTRAVKKKTETQTRYYLSSRKGSAIFFAYAIRGHWGIENPLHHVLDVVFREDECQSNTGYSAQNLGCLKRYALNLLRALDPDRSIAEATRACRDVPSYMLGLLNRTFAIK